MGLAKYLKAGKMTFNPIDKCIEVVNIGFKIKYCDVINQDWGQIYEKYVGQIFEEKGYKVFYKGLEEGILDHGIDLIAENDIDIIYIQCKYLKKHLTKSHIEWILYKASQELLKAYENNTKTVIFMLIVNNIDENFSKRIPKGFSNTISNNKYPLLEYFLNHNNTQNKVRLECVEINMRDKVIPQS